MALTKDERNARRKQRRLEARKERIKDKHCLNCTILLAARLEDAGRSYLYCRKCITDYKDEARRNRWRRYYYAHHSKLRKAMRERGRQRRAAI